MKKIIAIVLAFAFAFSVSAQGPASRTRSGLLGPRPAGAKAPSAQAPAAPQKPSDPGASKVDSGDRSIEFNGAALDMVLMVYANLVGKTVLKDPSAPAVSIVLQPKKGQELTDEDKILAIETVLEMNGIHLEPYGEKFVRALPRQSVRKDGIPLIMDPEAELGETTRVVSMMLTFENIALEEAQKALEGLKSDKGVLNVYERTGTILVTDTEMNLNRMREIAKRIDVKTPVTENVFVRQIKYAAAADIKTALEAIVQESQKELEKQGKSANTARPVQPSFPSNRLIGGRPGANPQPTVNQSLVTSVSDADRGMIRGKVLILSDERSNKLIIVTAQSNMDFFDKVIEQLDVETTPDIVVKVYRLKYAESEDVADMINDLIGNAVSSKSGKGNQNQNAKNGAGGNMTRATTGPKKSVNQRTGEAKTGELSKENTTVLSDERINGLVVMTNKELVPTIEQIIESMDVKLSQVLIETCIIEVNLNDDLVTGVDWVNQNWTGKNGYNVLGGGGGGSGGASLGSLSGLGSGKSYSDWATEARSVLLGSSTSGSSAGTLTTAQINEYIKSATESSTSPIGPGVNYFLKLDKLNIDMVISASKTDSRTKYIASPVVMTVDNKEATIEATQARKFLSNYQSSSSSSYYGSSVVPQYENKDIGIKIKVTPKINPNGTVMLEVEEEYSQVGAKQTILDPDSQQVAIDTALTRKMSADALLENMQTIVLCGLTETTTVDQETGIPVLKDIPWIGKWLFGSVEQTEARSELIIFMTPYVLNDGDAAQLEAIRRKRALSDNRAWDDHGWSASKLADSVSEKEQLRRLKDEAKAQDADRASKMAIEKWKVDRAKALKDMSKAERDQWLEMHKDELVEEDRKAEAKELGKTMEAGGEEEQEALKKLAAEIRKKKLAESEREIKTADEKLVQPNERAKIDAEKKKAKSEGEGMKPAADGAGGSAVTEDAKKGGDKPVSAVPSPPTDEKK